MPQALRRQAQPPADQPRQIGERDFVRLYFFEELPKAEISERLGIHSDRVRLVKSRALKSFRDAYEGFTQCPTAR